MDITCKTYIAKRKQMKETFNANETNKKKNQMQTTLL